MIKPAISTVLATTLCLFCCGCPSPGGDPEVSNKVTRYGTGEILTIAKDTDGETVVSLKWTGPNGSIGEELAKNVKLSTVKDLPSDFDPKVGDKLALGVDIEWVGKMSVGPPDTWGHVDKREIRFLPDGLPK